MGDTSVLKKMSKILGMFSETKHFVSVEEISSEMAVSLATGYRYVADMCDIGLLTKILGSYTLGPKIIELDYLIRSYDPVIQIGEKLMLGLADMTGCHALLCNIYDETITNVFYAPGKQKLNLTFTRGKPIPLFRGSQARAILAHVDRRKLQRLYLKHQNDPDALKIGRDWPEFNEAMKRVRKLGYYISHGELDAGVTGIAAPVFSEGKEVLGSLVLAYPSVQAPWMSEAALTQLVVENARELSSRISELSSGVAAETASSSKT